MNERETEKKILKSMTDIDDCFIQETEKKEPSAKAVYNRKKKIWKRVGTIAACVCVVAVAGTVLTQGLFRMGGAAPTESADSAATTEFYYANDMIGNSVGGAGGYGGIKSFDTGDMAEVEMAAQEDEAFEPASKAAGADPYQNVKLIKTADINIETTDFEKECGSLKERVDSLGGYFEYSDTYNGGYFDENVYRSGNFKVRVPAEKYDEFLKGISENSHVTNLSEYVENVGEQYFEIETRLNTLKTKVERLEELLAKAENISEIIEIENALSDATYQIEYYTSDLNRYDSLIGYSTFNVNIHQVSRVGTGVASSQTFISRLGRSLSNGFNDFVYGVEDFVLWISYNLITLIIIAAAVILIIKFRVVQRIVRLFRKDE